MLPRGRLEQAESAPFQGSNGTDGSWSCGPNSGYRALLLMEEKPGSYYDFVENCPKSFSKTAVTAGGLATTGLGWLGVCLAPFTAGISLIPAVPLLIGGAATTIAGGAASSDVGPGPKTLGEYLATKLVYHKARYKGYSSQKGQGSYEWEIRADIEYLSVPRIVLLVMGTTLMHYVNIIGVKTKSDLISPFELMQFDEAVILDTNGEIGSMSDANLRYWMDCDGYAQFLLSDRYNTVEFGPRH